MHGNFHKQYDYVKETDKETPGQSEDDKWQIERRKITTSSVFDIEVLIMIKKHVK